MNEFHDEFFYLLSIDRDDDDINDVASMAGVNLSEESANILATNSITVGAVTHSCKDEAFLSCAVLQRKMLEIGETLQVSQMMLTFFELSTTLDVIQVPFANEKCAFPEWFASISWKVDNGHKQGAALKFFL